MKNIIPINKLAVFSAAVCAVMLAFSHNASAVTNLAFNDQYVVGTITPGAPSDPADVRDYINFMIALAPGGSGTFGGQAITRSTNLFASLPAPTGGVEGTSLTIDLGAGGVYSYLFAKYDGRNDISQVWFIGDLTGEITIPGFGPNGRGLSHWTLFGPGGGNGVPDGGTTVMLLGAALSALGMARRYLKS